MLLGNSGGGSLMAMANAELGIGDGWVGMAAHPGEGVFMLQVIDPSVADEHDPFSTVARTRHVRPGQRLATVAGAVLVRRRVAGQVPGSAESERVARIDAIAKASIRDAADAVPAAASAGQGHGAGAVA